jgi:hypothetical protein
MLDLGIVFEAVKKVGEGLAALSKAKNLLLPDRSTAGVQLAGALDQIVRTFAAVDKAIADYKALAIAPGMLEHNPQGLAAVAGGHPGDPDRERARPLPRDQDDL